MKTTFSAKAALLVVLLVLMINLPLLHSTYTSWRVDRAGTDVTATVTHHRVLSPGEEPEYLLEFVLPAEIDPDQTKWIAPVDEATYDEAVAEERVGVRVLPERLSAHSVEGQVSHRLGLVLTLSADLALLAMLLLLWRFRGTLRPPLRAVAIEDVQRSRPGSELERVEGDLYLIRGEVSAIEDDEIVLDLGDRSVRVVLDGHHNPVGHQQPAQVRGRMIG